MSVLCFVVKNAGLFTQTVVNTVAECSALDTGLGAFVVQSAIDLATQQAQTPTLQSIFNIPLAADMEMMWWIGFKYPLIAYLTAWSLGVLINMFNTRNSNNEDN